MNKGKLQKLEILFLVIMIFNIIVFFKTEGFIWMSNNFLKDICKASYILFYIYLIARGLFGLYKILTRKPDEKIDKFKLILYIISLLFGILFKSFI